MKREVPARRRTPIAAGQRYGRLVAVEYVRQDRWGAAQWRFRCDCGNKKYVARPDQVRRGIITSCGCQRREEAAERCRVRVKHGHSRAGARSGEYVSWRNMLGRCHDPNNDSYPRYGGRGIKVCKRWLEFENFLADMGPKPAPRCMLGRIKSNRDYTPNNCRWESPIQQARNKSTNRFVTYRDRSMTIAAACEITGIPRNVVDARLRRGWTPERAVVAPVKFHKPRKRRKKKR